MMKDEWNAHKGVLFFTYFMFVMLSVSKASLTLCQRPFADAQGDKT